MCLLMMFLVLQVSDCGVSAGGHLYEVILVSYCCDHSLQTPVNCNIVFMINTLFNLRNTVACGRFAA